MRCIVAIHNNLTVNQRGVCFFCLIEFEKMDLPRIGKPAPNFTAKAVLEDKVFDISLSDYNKKYVVLLFFPMDL
jgi:hypothetical protein